MADMTPSTKNAPNFFPQEFDLETFFGVTMDLMGQLGEEIGLSQIFSQMGISMGYYALTNWLWELYCGALPGYNLW